ncbi:MAG: alpha-ketoglutarate decarboxylase, partial [Amnibacterium sp.]|nr:alpha-ketoglutarate decarboxylase [Amnibacterium sp.]
MSSQLTGTEEGAGSEFGANEWLVDELYERFLADRNSVDRSWWPVLEAYHPVDADAVVGHSETTTEPLADPTAEEPADGASLTARNGVTPDAPATSPGAANATDAATLAAKPEPAPTAVTSNGAPDAVR